MDREAAQVEQALRRAQQRQQNVKRPGRPRKTPVNNTITISNSSRVTITIDSASSSASPSSPHTSSSSSSHSTPSLIQLEEEGPSSPPSSSSPSPSVVPLSSASSSSSPSPSSSTASTSSSSPLAKVEKRQWTDWVANKALFAMIHTAVQSCRSFRHAVRSLQGDEKTANVFEDLTESTVRSWYEPRSFELKKTVEQRWKGEAIARSGRPSVMSKYPIVEEYVIDAITNIRAAGGTINSIIISSYFRGIIQARYPNLMEEFKFSRRWCRWWLAQTFPWTYKKGTTSGQKLPPDWEEQMRMMAKRVSARAAQHNILHPCFIINWDQTAVLLMQAHKYTYHNMREKQVPVIGQEEKRQITAVVASTLDGDLLPLQLIFKGQDKNKKQQKSVPTLHDTDSRRTADWHLTQTANHWSSLESMKDYVRLIIRPWVQAKGREHIIKYPHCILLLDCWSVHTSKEFRSWMATAYPSYHLIYVPAGCTGKAQPADVVLQRPFKSGVVNEFTRWMSTEIHHLVKGGMAPAEIKVDTGLARLKPKLVGWTWGSWDKLRRKKELIKEGWRKCGLGDVLDAAQQREAMRFCLNEPVEVLGEEPEQQDAGDTDNEDEVEPDINIED